MNALTALHAHDYHAASAWAQRARKGLGDTPAVAEVQASIRAARLAAAPGVHGTAAAPRPSAPAAAAPPRELVARTVAPRPQQSAPAPSARKRGVSAEGSPSVAAARVHGSSSQRTGGTETTADASDDAGSTDVPPGNAMAAESLVLRAATAARAGDIASPPGRSAYDLYMQALELDGGNVSASTGLRSLPDAAASRFRADVSDDNLEGAARMLMAVQEIQPTSTVLPGMREALRGAWINRAAHYRQIGDLEAAQRAAAQAQRVGSD